MPITPEDIKTLVEWLGPEGAAAGLERGHLTNADLMKLLRDRGLVVDKKTGRRQLSIELVMSDVERISKPEEELVRLSADELKRYFADRLVSSSELARLLDRMGIPAPGKMRGKLADFAAREISELGVYQRVAEGRFDPAAAKRR